MNVVFHGAGQGYRKLQQGVIKDKNEGQETEMHELQWQILSLVSGCSEKITARKQRLKQVTCML